jgi:hypothetical protein
MRTECNCDLPLYAYRDWLIEEGWEDTFIEEEFEFVVGFGGSTLEDSEGEYTCIDYWYETRSTVFYTNFIVTEPLNVFGSGWSVNDIDYDIKNYFYYVNYSGDGRGDWIWGYRI